MHICCFIKGTLRWHKKCTFSGWVSLAKNANFFCWSKKNNSAKQRAAWFFFKFEWRNSCLTHTHTHTQETREGQREGKERGARGMREKRKRPLSLSLSLSFSSLSLLSRPVPSFCSPPSILPSFCSHPSSLPFV